jgi:hypothetical protein
VGLIDPANHRNNSNVYVTKTSKLKQIKCTRTVFEHAEAETGTDKLAIMATGVKGETD